MVDFFLSIITNPGFIPGAVCGALLIVVALRYQQTAAGAFSFLVCVAFGLAAGFLGSYSLAIMLVLCLILCYVYIRDRQFAALRRGLGFLQENESNNPLVRLWFGIRPVFSALVRNSAGMIGFLGLIYFLVLTLVAPLQIEYDGKVHRERLRPGARSLFQAPNEEFPLGLDWQGRDILSHLVHGGGTLIITAIQAGVITTIIAVALGAAAALLGGVFDTLLSAVSNFFLTIPNFPLLLVLASVIEFESNFSLALLFAVLNWPTLMRAVRAQVFSLKQRDYIEVAFALDLGLWHITVREVLPNMISYIVVNMIFSIRFAMYNIVGLVFLGMVPLKEPDWGVMIVDGRKQGAFAGPESIWMVLTPVLAIALFQLSLVMFTRSLEEIFNPRLRQGL